MRYDRNVHISRLDEIENSSPTPIDEDAMFDTVTGTVTHSRERMKRIGCGLGRWLYITAVHKPVYDGDNVYIGYMSGEDGLVPPDEA